LMKVKILFETNISKILDSLRHSKLLN